MKRVAIAAVLLFAACATPPQRDERVTVVKPAFDPDPVTGFAALDVFLVHQCGSLDCHGSRFRSMRVYGSVGLRLAPSTPGDTNFDPNLAETREKLVQPTPEEIRASYESVAALEPEILSDVVRDHGANPERLTLVRKARGAENHKGYNLVVPGSTADTCILSWLRGAIDAKACYDAAVGASPCVSSSDGKVGAVDCAKVFSR